MCTCITLEYTTVVSIIQYMMFLSLVHFQLWMRYVCISRFNILDMPRACFKARRCQGCVRPAAAVR